MHNRITIDECKRLGIWDTDHVWNTEWRLPESKQVRLTLMAPIVPNAEEVERTMKISHPDCIILRIWREAE